MARYTKTKSDITGLRDVSEVVAATEKLAAANIQRLRRGAKALRDYVAILNQILTELTAGRPPQGQPWLEARPTGQKTLLVVFGGHGLVGDLDQRLVQATVQAAPEYDRLVVIGEHGDKLLREAGLEPAERLPAPRSDTVTAEEAGVISDYALRSFRSGESRQVDILFAGFYALVDQRPKRATFLPFVWPPLAPPEGTRTAPSSATPADGWPIYSPSRGTVEEYLLNAYFRVYFKACLAEAKLAEEAARTVAMEHASAKAEREVRRLTLEYFKQRRRELSRRQIESFFAHQTV